MSIGSQKKLLKGGAALAALMAFAQAVPAYAQEQTYSFDIPAQDMGPALRAFARASRQQVAFDDKTVRGKRSMAVKGTMTARAALDKLIQGSGLTIQRGTSGLYIIRASAAVARQEAPASLGEDADQKGVAEILVVGSRSQNVDIRRTEEDPQPYVVIDRNDIARSGATDVNGLLREQLPMAQGQGTIMNNQAGAGNLSQVDLRGLGANQTLILVDGRRVPSVATTGIADQADLNGIPLAAIERIEVLPTTASGIYGGSATGGVINVVLRHDYKGLELQATYGTGTSGEPGNLRLEASGGLNFNEGRTRILVNASYAYSDHLQYEDRDTFARGIDWILVNNPAAIYDASIPPLGATTNIRSTTGAPLTLKSQYGGGAVGSAITYVPYGYAGPQSDNGAGLIGNAGKFNLDLAPTAQAGGGGRRDLLGATETASASLNLRHSFNSWLDGFAEASWSHNSSLFNISNVTASYILTPTDAGNPFNERIRVTVPMIGVDGQNSFESNSLRFLGGLIFKLPASWAGALDYSWSRVNFRTSSPSDLNGLQLTQIKNGSLNVFRDLDSFPLDFSPFEREPGNIGPANSTLQALSLRLSGPVPFSLPGGKPTMTLLGEYRRESLSDTISTLPGQMFEYYARSQKIGAVYGELLLPLIGPANAIPLIRSLDIQIAARAEHYDIVGSNYSGTFAPAVRTTSNNVFDKVTPTLAVRWEPLAGIAFRASYGEGFLPPSMAQLVPNPPELTPGALLTGLLGLTDPVRGGEALGDILIQTGGNASIKPESSSSVSLGTVLTPSFLPGFRFSADWTRIRKTDNISNYGFFDNQANFASIIALRPDRFTRDTDPATFGSYGVGPITAIDASLINLASARYEALDFAIDQKLQLGGGTLSLAGRATRTLARRTQLTDDAPVLDLAGTTTAPDWKGRVQLGWDKGPWTFAWSTDYVSRYYLNTAHSVVVNQGAATIASQMTHGLFVRRAFGEGDRYQLSLKVNNLFDQAPRVNVNYPSLGYSSPWGSALQRTVYLSLRGAF